MECHVGVPEAVVEGILSWDDTYVNGPLPPDTVVRQQVIHLIQGLAKLTDPLIYVIHQAQRQVLAPTQI